MKHKIQLISTIVMTCATVAIAIFAGAQIYETNRLKNIQEIENIARLNRTIQHIFYEYPSGGYEDLKVLSVEERIEWFTKIYNLLILEMDNPVLLADRYSFCRWNNAISTTRIYSLNTSLVNKMLSRLDDPSWYNFLSEEKSDEFFVVHVSSVHKDVMVAHEKFFLDSNKIPVPTGQGGECK